ncbi:sigma-70 family RNA polymerase sigma factor [Streptomyces purpurogeneiscleroticus]|uniref:sigma-70 family RNA polymerase sigma factor n=1 Tax=Streptomyces purpurogeneiscleroticus TaxID=68259 RepID=UPI001CBC30DC|nr:sigma-70 family RNA polymerase sigma factor [Streptomyces purpurogeneiscleroticus]MBZ4019254.1 RNA polymerase subunit sigma [Streptomyces purpurogeneiscleroticus]
MAARPHEVVPVDRRAAHSSTPPRDEDLHRRLVYGDESALGEVYDAFGGLVHAVARSVTRSTNAAEDVVQEVLTHLWARPYAFDPARGSLRAWLSMLAHRRAVDRVRDAAREPGAALADAALLHAALTELPLAQRQVLHLAYFAGRTYRQVAVELGIPEDTAKTRLRAALGSLADRLADPPDPAVERGI